MKRDKSGREDLQLATEQEENDDTMMVDGEIDESRRKRPIWMHVKSAFDICPLGLTCNKGLSEPCRDTMVSRLDQLDENTLNN